MTEQDERAIYEWAYEWLHDATLVNGSPWELKHSAHRVTAFWDDGTALRTTILPQQDMNFCFGVCIPKLRKECDVSYKHGRWDIQPWKQAYRLRVEPEDFYDALLAYIREVKLD